MKIILQLFYILLRKVHAFAIYEHFNTLLITWQNSGQVLMNLLMIFLLSNITRVVQNPKRIIQPPIITY